MMTKKKDASKTIARNKRAIFDYEIVDQMETGMVLEGCEVKSIRAGDVSLKDSFVQIKNGELWLIGTYIKLYEQSRSEGYNAERSRKLLAHKQEINRWFGKTKSKGYVIVPMALYFKGNRVKLKIGIGSPKKQFDKRRALKDADVKRDLNRRGAWK